MNTVANEQRTRGAKGRQGRSGKRRRADLGEGSILRYPPLPRAQEPLCLCPEAREVWLTGVCIFLSITGLMGGAQTEMVSHVPFLWQARAPGL